jgi:linoleoyl-CoA desaturase
VLSALALAKILENMEIGHNVMHGQYDWTRDPTLDSRSYEWDMACTGDDWRRSHNDEHHTFTNILGQDRDLGYGWLRVCPEQPWRPHQLVQPLVALGLAVAFEWGIATHDLRVDELLDGKQPIGKFVRRARPFAAKAAWQLFKDFAFYPALAGVNAPRVFAGNLLASVARNVWAFAVIFCGHFPDGVEVFAEEATVDESRGRWYLRQLRGSANIDGGRWLWLLSGHLSHQIEHHLFPDLPASRYPEIAPRVRAICARYGQPYRSGSLRRQLGAVARRLVRLSVPTRFRV